MIIFLSHEAERDFEKICDYIFEEDYMAVYNVRDKIYNAIKMLAAHPNLARVGRVEGTRELVIANTSYIIIYEVINNNLVILRIFHS